MALLAVTPITVAGTLETLAAANAGGDTVVPGPGVFLAVKNADAAAKTVTLVVPGNLATGDAYPDKAYTVAAGTTQFIPVLPLYRDPATGVANVTYSAVTSTTVAAFSI